MLTAKKIYKCFRDAAFDTVRHDGIEHAGYLAFLALLSLFPFLVFSFALAGYFGTSEAGLKLINIILESHLIPNNVIPGLEPRIREIASGPPHGLLTVSIVGAIWTASSMVDGLRTILNRAYRVSTPPAYIWRRLMAIGEFIFLTALITSVMFILIIAPNIWEAVKHTFHIENMGKVIGLHNFTESHIWYEIRYSITTLLLFFVVVLAYMIIPNTKQGFLSVLPGAAVVILLWFIVGSMLSRYLSDFNQVNVIYGSLGGIIGFLLFFFFTAMIFIFGAELNYRIEKAKGHKIEEKEKS